MLDSNTKTQFLLHSIWIKRHTQSIPDGHMIRITDSFENTLMLGKIEAGGEGDGRGWDGWMASPTQWTWVWVNPRGWWWTGRPDMLQSMGSQRDKKTWLSNWTEPNLYVVLTSWESLSRNLHPVPVCSICFSQRLWLKVRCPAAFPVKPIKR